MIDYPIRVLVVDDSAYMRMVLRKMLEQSPLVEVIGSAHDGIDALEKTDELSPDVVVVDLYMPRLNGVDYVRKQMMRKPLPIILCTSAVGDSSLLLEALEVGAADFVQKPTALALDSIYNIQRQLVDAVIGAKSIAINKLPGGVVQENDVISPTVRLPEQAGCVDKIDAVVIGLSTGGPNALRMLLPRFPANMPVPMAIVLHMPVGYTHEMARKFNESSQIEVLESQEGMEMLPGRAILAQAGFHTRLKRLAGGLVVTTLNQDPISSLYIPSVDELFISAGEVYNGRILGVVMTGMGNDGTKGSAWIKAAGGKIFAEAERTSVVFGMPRSVIEAGLADQIVGLDVLPEVIMEAVR